MRQYAQVRASFLNRGTSRPCSKGWANVQVFQSRHQQSKRQRMERAESPELSPLPAAEPGEAAKLWGAEPGADAKLWGAAPALGGASLQDQPALGGHCCIPGLFPSPS